MKTRVIDRAGTGTNERGLEALERGRLKVEMGIEEFGGRRDIDLRHPQCKNRLAIRGTGGRLLQTLGQERRTGRV